MIKEELSKRATVYKFDEINDYITYVYVIKSSKYIYVIDTFCGPDYMKEIIEDIKNSINHTLVINTHFHWDHIWGNCAFNKCNIISHSLCPVMIDKSWDEMYYDNKMYIKGEMTKRLPDTIFDNILDFPADNIKIFHSPGHTVDSISIFDSEDNFLYVGDNLERPRVFVESPDIDTYIKTITDYLKYNAKNIFAGHTLDLNEKDIHDTVEYLERFK